MFFFLMFFCEGTVMLFFPRETVVFPPNAFFPGFDPNIHMGERVQKAGTSKREIEMSGRYAYNMKSLNRLRTQVA